MSLYNHDNIYYVTFMRHSTSFSVFGEMVPIIQVFVTSFAQWDGFNAPQFNGIRNYVNLFSSSSFLVSLKNLFLWALVAMFLHVGFGTLVAFVFYQRRR